MVEDEEKGAVSIGRQAKQALRRQVGEAEDDRRVGRSALPCGADESAPLEERRRRFLELSERIRRQLEARGVTEETVQRDFEAWRKARRRR